MSNSNDGTQKSSTTRHSALLGRSAIVDFFQYTVPIFPILGSFEANQPFNLVVLGLIIHAAQCLSFVVNPHFSQAWRYILGDGVDKALYAFHFAIFDPALVPSASATVAYILLAIAAVLVLYIILILSYYKIAHADTDKQHEAFVYLNRGVIHSLSTVLLIPVLQLCFSVMVCNDHDQMWLYPEDSCWSANHIGLLVLGIVVACFVLPFAYLVVVCQFEESYKSEHLRARAHSLADDVSFFHTVSSSFLMAVMLAFNQPGGYAIIHGFSAAMVAGAYAWYLPHYNMIVNRFYVTVHVVEAFASAVAASAMLNESARLASVAPVIFLGCLPFIIAISWMLSTYRLSGEYLHAMGLATLGHSYGDEDQLKSVRGLPDSERFARCSLATIDSLLQDVQLKTNIDMSFSAASGATNKKRQYPAVTNPMLSKVYSEADVDLAARFCIAYSRELKQVPSFAMITQAVHLHVRGTIRFPFSAFVLARFVRFICDFVPGMGSTGMQLLEDITLAHGGLATRYRTFKMTDDLRGAVGIKSQSHLLHADAARTMHCKVLTHMNAFWMKLTEPSVNIGLVSSIADDITESRKQALVQFRRAVQHQTSPDPQLIARMGAFLNDVMLDSEGAAECFNEAREVHEARQARSMRGTRQHTTMLDMDALTSHLLSLLSQRSESTMTKSSSVVKYLLLNVSIVFLLVLGMCGVLLYVSLTLHDANTIAVDRSVSSGYVRSSPQRFVSSLYQMDYGNESVVAHGVLNDEAALFSEHFEKLTSGEHKTGTTSHNKVYKSERLPVYTTQTDVTRASSFWGFGERLLTSFASVLANNETLGSSSMYLKETAADAGVTFDRSMQLSEADHHRYIGTTVRLLVSAFVVGIAAIVAVYIAFLVSFQRTQLGRVFTFQLFTLIPFDALEKLSTETRDKINSMNAEAKSSTKPEDEEEKELALGAESVEESQSTSRSHSLSMVSSTASHSTRGSLAGPALQQAVLISCLKKTAAPRKAGLSVTINSNVTVFGASNDDKKPTAAAEAAKEAIEDEDDSGASTTPAKPRSESGRQEAFTNLRMGLVAANVSVFVLLVVAIIFIYVSMSSINPTIDVHEELEAILTDIEEYDHGMDRMHELVLLYLQSGDEESLSTFLDLRSKKYKIVNKALRGSLTSSEGNVATSIRKDWKEVIESFDRGLVAFGFANATSDERIEALMNETTKAQLLSKEAPSAALAKGAPDSPEFFKHLAVLIVTDPALDRSVEDVYSRIVELREDITSRITSEKNRNYLSYAYAALVFSALAFALSLVFSVVDIDWWSNGAQRSTLWLIQAGTILAPLIAVSLFVNRAANLTSFMEEQQDVHVSLAGSARSLQVMPYYGRSFVVRAESNPWVRYHKNIELKPLTSIISTIVDHDLSDDTMEMLFQEATASFLEVKSLHEIANAMKMYVGNNTDFFVEKDMQDVFDHTYWNFAGEDNYREILQQFPGRQPVYSNRAADLALPPADIAALSIATVFDERYIVAHKKLVKAIDAILEAVHQAEGNALSSKATDLYRLQLAALALTGLPILVCLLNASKLMGIVSNFLGLSASASTNTLDTSLYTMLLQRCRYSLLFIAALFLITFSVAVWSTGLVVQPIQWVDLSSERDFYVVVSLQHLRQTFVAGSGGVVDFNTVAEDADNLETVMKQLAFDDVHDGKLNAAAKDGTYDELVYGTDDFRVREQAVLTFYRTMCEENPAAPDIVARGPFGNLKFPVESFLHYWISALREVDELASKRPRTEEHTKRIREIVDQLSTLEPTLLAALRQSTLDLRTNTIDRSRNISSALIAVVSLLLAGVIVVYGAVFFPMIQRLVEEEESARLLLRMIPLNVRDQVPAISEFIETGRIDNAAELQKKFEASEKLLQNILPQKIAARLKSGESPIADMHPSLTILFTDFVGFTKRSSSMQADEIVDFLNEVFLDFDLIVDLLELEKIKTIGDAYFMAGGLDPRISDHALRVVEAGIQMFNSLAEHNERHPTRALLRMRLGIHTGPAVAGVIGTKKVAYDLWGESVEIANAMESTAVPNRVHISQPTADLVAPFFTMEPRGELPREKESVPDNMPKTYLVCNRLQASPYQHIYRPRQFRQRIGGGQNQRPQ